MTSTYIYTGTAEDIERTVQMMRRLGIRRLRVNETEIELEPSASTKPEVVDVEPMNPQGVFAESTGAVCACGHSWATEHVEDGCLMGCSHDLCSSSGGAPDVG